MTPRELPLGTKLITDTQFVWIKISETKWRCVGTGTNDGWKIGDIYTDFGDETIYDGKYTLPFDLYLKQAELL